MKYVVRPEHPGDAPDIRRVTEAAFKVAEHSSGAEAAIIDALRASNALSLSLVATDEGEIVGHVAFSPVTINGADIGWFGLGPVSVTPKLHGQGLGGMLIRAGLEQLKATGAGGCVVLGDPDYYQRFGFEHDPAVRYEEAPPEYFMKLPLNDSEVSGSVAFHDGFSAS